MQANPNVHVHADLLVRLPANQKVVVRETDPASGNFCEVEIARINTRFIAIKLRDWPGDRFELRVDLISQCARLIAPEEAPRAGIEHLTATVFRTGLQLFVHEPLL